MLVAQIVLWLMLAYALGGVVIGVPFVVRGVGRVDDAARGAPLGFRLLILPGVVALWPVLLVKWLQASKTERHS